MNPKERRLIILRKREQEDEPLPFAQLSEKLNWSCNYRTTLRYLHQLIAVGLVQKSGFTKGVKYFATRKPKHGGEDAEKELTLL